MEASADRQPDAEMLQAELQQKVDEAIAAPAKDLDQRLDADGLLADRGDDAHRQAGGIGAAMARGDDAVAGFDRHAGRH